MKLSFFVMKFSALYGTVRYGTVWHGIKSCFALRRTASYSDATAINLTLTNLKSHKLDLLALQSWERVITKLVSTKFKMPSLPNIA